MFGKASLALLLKLTVLKPIVLYSFRLRRKPQRPRPPPSSSEGGKKRHGVVWDTFRGTDESLIATEMIRPMNFKFDVMDIEPV
ncbi:hypothetical protein JTE90_019392 [Oedothorax gibbosus]|uniref:Uncharacterized protein n=1 Tax=Oedothorax gibbosus TaxID=931172 RepID=A0AAV6UBC0_9ARAC|nr:hypothetical protein JTE90_019392 [Oedothorax gibbosus]